MTEGTKATVFSNGLIKWNPPASFKSSCDINVLHFPFDQQTCGLQFSSWTYNIKEVRIKFILVDSLQIPICRRRGYIDKRRPSKVLDSTDVSLVVGEHQPPGRERNPRGR
jgi:hypothetical protein